MKFLGIKQNKPSGNMGLMSNHNAPPLPVFSITAGSVELSSVLRAPINAGFSWSRHRNLYACVWLATTNCHNRPVAKAAASSVSHIPTVIQVIIIIKIIAGMAVV